MKFYLKLAQHFICQKNSKKLSFTSIVAILGIAFGICSFLVVITVLNSFQNEMKNIILSVNPHIVIYSEQGIENYNQIENKINKILKNQIQKQAPFIYYESILSHKQNTSAVYIRAILPKESPSAQKLNALITPKNALYNLSSQIPSIILGKELSKNLHVVVGDTLNLMQFDKQNSKIKNQPLIVAGILNIGISQYDKQYGLMDFHQAQKLFGTPNWSSGIELNLNFPSQAQKVAAQLESNFSYTIVPWQNIDKNLFDQIRRDGGSIQLIVLIISFVSVFNIIVTLSLTVIDRSKQIALLRCLGAQKKHIIGVFIFSGIVLGLFGSIFGLLIGTILLKLFSHLSLGNLQQFYYLEKIPVHFNFQLIAIAFITSILLSFLGALYPAWRATKISPIAGLK